jgi:hypothetical protein
MLSSIRDKSSCKPLNKNEVCHAVVLFVWGEERRGGCEAGQGTKNRVLRRGYAVLFTVLDRV